MAFEKTNKIIEDYGYKKLSEVQTDGRGMGIVHREDSASPSDSLGDMKVSFSRKMGDIISVVKFSLRRTLFYAYHGAGKGQGGKKGSTWLSGNGRKKTAPSSLGTAGTGNRSAKPFLDTITRDADELLDQVAESTMDEIIDLSFKKFK